MEEQYINIGPLSSFNSLNLYIGPQLYKLRNSYALGKKIIPVWDLRNIPPKGASISALTAFLSISKKLRDFTGEPIKIVSHWQPKFQGFLSDIGFLRIAQDFDLYDWQGMLGGYPTGTTNPYTKILYYSNLPDIDKNNIEQVIAWKDEKRQDIKHSVLFRVSNLFQFTDYNDMWVQNVFSITTAELVVNSLLHGNDIAFVGVQRSTVGITTSVCDSGIGFPKSLYRNHEMLRKRPLLSHANALVFASLQSKNKIGLYRVIDDIISCKGYVVMSSFNSEIRWEKELWDLAIQQEIVDNENVLDVKSLSEPLQGRVSKERVRQGYYKEFDTFLIGSRITFEIPL